MVVIRKHAFALKMRWNPLRFQSSGVIRPLGLFDLTSSTYLSFFGLLVTYTIVLVQFRFGE